MHKEHKMIIKDSDLVTASDLEDRFQSICRQLDKLDDIFKPRDFDKHQAKYAKLVQRRERIYDRIGAIKRAQA